MLQDLKVFLSISVGYGKKFRPLKYQNLQIKLIFFCYFPSFPLLVGHQMIKTVNIKTTDSKEYLYNDLVYAHFVYLRDKVRLRRILRFRLSFFRFESSSISSAISGARSPSPCWRPVRLPVWSYKTIYIFGNIMFYTVDKLHSSENLYVMFTLIITVLCPTH